jgi:hypothetical protein
MPLRDHFRSPVDDLVPWESFHACWPVVIVQNLRRSLPRRFTALPRVHSGSQIEVDVATFEGDDLRPYANVANGHGGAITAVWSPASPTFVIETDQFLLDEYEVRIYDTKRARRLVAAIEIVSYANKDRPEHRRAFVAKCAALIQQQVSVTIIDPVTTSNFNLYSELLTMVGQEDPAFAEHNPLYAVSCRQMKRGDTWQFESWAHNLALGQSLPILPLWLAEDLAVPLELEQSYEQTCQDLNIP